MNNVDRIVSAFLLGLGFIVMFLFGRAYQGIIAAHNSHKAAVALVPKLRAAFWALVRGAVLIVVAAVLVVLMLGTYAATGSKTATPSPSPSPSHPR